MRVSQETPCTFVANSMHCEILSKNRTKAMHCTLMLVTGAGRFVSTNHSSEKLLFDSLFIRHLVTNRKGRQGNEGGTETVLVLLWLLGNILTELSFTGGIIEYSMDVKKKNMHEKWARMRVMNRTRRRICTEMRSMEASLSHPASLDQAIATTEDIC